MRVLSLLTAALLLLGSTSVAARNWASAGGWDIAEVSATTCGMGSEYEGKGETYLALTLDTDGDVFLSVSNYGWTAVPGSEYNLVDYTSFTELPSSPNNG